MRCHSTPYTNNKNRLADVIAAIQVMATYKYYKLDFRNWAYRIEGKEDKNNYWKSIFQQHPEFFRLDSKKEKASLVWRRNYQKLYDVDNEEKISKERLMHLSEYEKKRLSRAPLTNADINTLINTAIHLHSGELNQKKSSRWWASGVFTIVGTIIGLFSKHI